MLLILLVVLLLGHFSPTIVKIPITALVGFLLIRTFKRLQKDNSLGSAVKFALFTQIYFSSFVWISLTFLTITQSFDIIF
tara:strand:+ start:200 stop:439 length:240 start_codon:yes stop_codon:yes gene_type:complete